MVCGGRLGAQHALGIHIHRIHRCAGGHKQPIAVTSAEAQIGATFRQIDTSDQFALRIEYRHAVEAFLAHTPAAPQIAVDIAAKSIRRAIGFGGDQGAPIAEPATVVEHIKRVDFAQRRTGDDDIEFRFVG